MGQEGNSERGAMGYERLETQLNAIEKTVVEVRAALTQVIELAKHVALLQERAEHHREETSQMEQRFSASYKELKAQADTEGQERQRSAERVHTRLDAMKRIVHLTIGGAIVVSALLAYAAESAKVLLTEVVRLHDAELLLSQRVKILEDQTKGK